MKAGLEAVFHFKSSPKVVELFSKSCAIGDLYTVVLWYTLSKLGRETMSVNSTVLEFEALESVDSRDSQTSMEVN